jgi:hypothetical protein
MESRVQAIALLLLGCALAHGQTVAPVTASTLPASAAIPGISLANTAPVPVSAVLLQWSLPVPAASRVSRASAIKFYDAATEPLAAKPIPPHGSATVPVAAPGQSVPQVLAVLFTDGTSWGDAASVGRLAQRRVYMLQALTSSLADLNAAATSPAVTKAALLGQFQSAESAEQATAADGDQKACIHSVRGPALVNLQGPAALSGVISHEISQAQSRLAALKAYGVGQ